MHHDPHMLLVITHIVLRAILHRESLRFVPCTALAPALVFRHAGYVKWCQIFIYTFTNSSLDIVAFVVLREN
jgi:hypothetical protein